MWPSRAVKLVAGRSSVVVLVAALASAPLGRRAGATGSAGSGRCSSVNVKDAQVWARIALVSDQGREKNRVEKLLEDAQIKLSVVASDIFGVSGRDMMAADRR